MFNFGGNNFIWILIIIMFMQCGNGFGGGCSGDNSLLIILLFFILFSGNGFGICEAK